MTVDFNKMLRDFATVQRAASAPAPDTYRGWAITWDYGEFTATGPNYDASYEGPEDGWVDNGHRVSCRTREGLIEEVDAWFEENEPVPSDGEIYAAKSFDSPEERQAFVATVRAKVHTEIDWRMFSVDVQARWKRPVDMKNDLGLSQQTLMSAWHGRPVGVLPMLRACMAMGANPLRYLAPEGQP